MYQRWLPDGRTGPSSNPGRSSGRVTGRAGHAGQSHACLGRPRSLSHGVCSPRDAGSGRGASAEAASGAAGLKSPKLASACRDRCALRTTACARSRSDRSAPERRIRTGHASLNRDSTDQTVRPIRASLPASFFARDVCGDGFRRRRLPRRVRHRGGRWGAIRPPKRGEGPARRAALRQGRSATRAHRRSWWASPTVWKNPPISDHPLSAGRTVQGRRALSALAGVALTPPSPSGFLAAPIQTRERLPGLLRGPPAARILR
jgi:hypothetical protein